MGGSSRRHRDARQTEGATTALRDSGLYVGAPLAFSFVKSKPIQLSDIADASSSRPAADGPQHADRQLLHHPLPPCCGLWFDEASCSPIASSRGTADRISRADEHANVDMYLFQAVH